ncbi:Endoglucanase 3 [Bienertia sinuspersici]
MASELKNSKAVIQWATNYFYKCTTATPMKQPNSNVAVQTVAALAAASMVFASMIERYSRAYNDSLASVVCPLYCSYSNYKDKLLCGTVWLYRATKQSYYLNFTNSLGANDTTDIFNCDNNFAGA